MMTPRTGLPRALALLGLLTLTALVAPAQAAVSDWAVSDGGRMRMAALPNEQGGYDAMLDIELKPGWKTYWRYPGDAGLPPEIDLSASDNVALTTTAFPAPEIGEDEGGRFYGYHQPMAIVLKLKSPSPQSAARLKASVLIGVCNEICLPFQASFDLALSPGDRPEGDEFIRLAQARSSLPEAPSPGFSIAASGLSAGGKALDAQLALPAGASPEIAIAPSSGLSFGPSRLTPGSDGRMRLTLPIKRKPANGAASVTLLIKAGGRAIETTLAVK